MMDKERLKKIKEELEWEWNDVSYVVNQNDVKWLIQQADHVEKLIKAHELKDMEHQGLVKQLKKKDATIGFLKLKLVDFEKYAEMIRRIADNELIKNDARELRDDISDTFKELEGN